MSELRDINGRQIYPGDLLRTYHFTLPRRRRKMYLYHVAVQEGDYLYAVPAAYLNPSTKRLGGKYLLTLSTIESTQSEIIAGYGDGSQWWIERVKVK